MMLKTIFITLLTSVLLGFASTARAQVESLTLRVDGLACPFCAYGLEKKLKKLKGARSWDIKINEGTAIIQWRPEEPLDIVAIGRAVKKAGFTLRGIRGTFVGTVGEDNGKLFLAMPPPVNQRFHLFENATMKKLDHAQEGKTTSVSGKTRNQLQTKQRVRIVGAVHGHKNAETPLGLDIETLQKISPGSGDSK